MTQIWEVVVSCIKVECVGQFVRLVLGWKAWNMCIAREYTCFEKDNKIVKQLPSSYMLYIDNLNDFLVCVERLRNSKQ